MISSIVEAVFRHAEIQPDKLCLVDEGREVTYLQYKVEIQKLARVFADKGIGTGTAVVVEAQQTITYLAVQLALQLIGAVFVPVERNCAADKTEAIAMRCSAAAILGVKPVESDYPFLSYEELEELVGAAEPLIVQAFPAGTNVCELLFSTGTTGKEKGITLTNNNNIALAENVMYGVEMELDNVEMIPSPMNHSHGLRRYYANMVKGATVVLTTGVMNVRGLFSAMDKYGVNSMDLVPTALSVLLKLSKGKLADYSGVIRYIQLGAAPLMQADKEKIKAMLPNTRLYNFYGSTESGCICIYNFNRPDEKANCIGRPTHNARILITGDNREEIVSDAAHTGLLASCGGMNMLGYWQDPEETARAMQSGCVFSNDEAYFDADGDIILLGRKGDVINVGGNKVAPEEVENAAKKMEGISDCGCIPVSDDMKGQVPKLYVQMDAGVQFDSVAVRTWLANSLEPYKIPKYIEEIDSIPRSYNGKLLRRELAKLHK